MNTEINLAIRRDRKKTFAKTESIRKIRVFAIAFLFLVGALSTILFLIIVSSPLPALRARQAEAASNLARYQTQFGQNLLIKNQLLTINDLLEKRPDLRKAIDVFLTLIPSGVVLSSMDITETAVDISIEASSIEALDQLFSSIQEKAQQRMIPADVTTSGIAFSPTTGRYVLSISFE